jgi:hypothetical protein
MPASGATGEIAHASCLCGYSIMAGSRKKMLGLMNLGASKCDHQNRGRGWTLVALYVAGSPCWSLRLDQQEGKHPRSEQMAQLIEIVLIFGIFGFFAYVIVPLGSMVMGAFLTLVGGLTTTKSHGSASLEAKGFKLSWSGAAGLGIILAGIILLFANHN